MSHNLNRFISTQTTSYPTALEEIKAGRKQTHWMWFIFPQLAGLGTSETAKFYGIKDLAEARDYLKHPMLRNRLLEISIALLDINDRTANQIFGSPDDLKLKSCMTLFSQVENTDAVFEAVLKKYFNGTKDDKTLQLLK